MLIRMDRETEDVDVDQLPADQLVRTLYPTSWTTCPLTISLNCFLPKDWIPVFNPVPLEHSDAAHCN